jgi:predicted nucleic acid-binding Zn ribbon protein
MPHSKGFGRRTDRRTRDMVPIGDVVDALMREDVFSRGMPIATLARRWPELVGERLARATKPTSLEGGVLLIQASDGPWGAQAKYLADEIRERADQALGTGSVRSVKIVIARGPS